MAVKQAEKLVSEISEMLLDNDRVKVYKFRLKPGHKTTEHYHADYVVYSQSDSVLRIIVPNGPAEEMKLKSGVATFRKTQTHSAENIGNTEAVGLVVELKK